MAGTRTSEQEQADVVICGAGIAGIAAAYFLSLENSRQKILLVDERPPLSLTSDKSSECYRNWWPGPDGAMIALMNRSIDLLEALAEETGNRFLLNRRGYLYCLTDPTRLPALQAQAERAARQGAGPLRLHRGLPHDPPYRPLGAAGGWPSDGADLLLDRSLIRRHFPALSPDVVAALHVRRCGWFSGQQLGMTMLERARGRGVRLVEGRVTGVAVVRERVAAVQVTHAGISRRIATGCFVNAAGPFLPQVCRLLGVEVPVFWERHLKLSFNDQEQAVPRQAPLLILANGQKLAWSDEERAELEGEAELAWLLAEMPAGAHLRPEGEGESPAVLMLWPYHNQAVEPLFPLPLDPLYPELVLRGLSRLLPGLAVYRERLPRVVVDGGYYTKTAENRPLIGPLPVQGAYLMGAFSGFGLMAAPAAGELLAAIIGGRELPAFAPAFSLSRYQDPAYRQALTSWGESAQL